MVYRLAVLCFSAFLLGCDSSPTVPRIDEATFAPELGVNLSQMTQTGTGLYLQNRVSGTGDEAFIGASVQVYYRGWLTDGTLFDSRLEPDEPATFGLFPGSVIQGFAEGIRGMRVGGTRLLVIPPRLGYGSTPTGDIPANSILVFEVRLVRVN